MIIKSESGLTLTELLISITFLSLVVLSAVAISSTANRFLTSENNQVRVAAQASNILEFIAKDISLSFGGPANNAFNILALGPNSGNSLQLRRFDVAPEGPDANDRWVGYRYDNVNKIIEYNSDVLGAGSWVTIARNAVALNPIFQAIDSDGDGNVLNDNVIRIEITCRQDPNQPASIINSEVRLTTTIRISAVSSS